MSTEGTTEESKLRLKEVSQTRHIKVWHDHSEIAGHGHFLVLVSAIYDTALYYTDKEILEATGKKVDVRHWLNILTSIC